MKQNSIKSTPRLLCALALVGEIVLLYYGISFLLFGYMPLRNRLIGSAIFFPLAALFAWWSGSLLIGNRSILPSNWIELFKTFPVILLLCVYSVAAAISILVLFGVF